MQRVADFASDLTDGRAVDLALHAAIAFLKEGGIGIRHRLRVILKTRLQLRDEQVNGCEASPDLTGGESSSPSRD